MIVFFCREVQYNSFPDICLGEEEGPKYVFMLYVS